MFLLLKYPSPPPPQIVECFSSGLLLSSLQIVQSSSPFRQLTNLFRWWCSSRLSAFVRGSSFSDSAVCRRAVLVTSPFQLLCSSPQISNQAREPSKTKIGHPPRETPLFSRQAPGAQVRKQLKESSARIDGLRDLHREWQGHGAGPGRDTARFGGKSPATAYKRCCKL